MNDKHHYLIEHNLYLCILYYTITKQFNKTIFIDIHYKKNNAKPLQATNTTSTTILNYINSIDKQIKWFNCRSK